MLNFSLIGDGTIAKRHKKAIEMIGGKIINIYDPQKPDSNFEYSSNLDQDFFKKSDIIVICSPNQFHFEQIKIALSSDKKIIVEKPMVLPWQPIIDDDRINIVLQLRWLDLPPQADIVEVVMVRNEEYFNTWKGNPFYTGGVFYLLFIHYIDLAIRLKSKFKGLISTEGKQYRKIDSLDLMSIDMDCLYYKMYHDIIYEDKGVKPKEIMYLNWLLERNGWIYGMGKEVLNTSIELDFTFLRGTS